MCLHSFIYSLFGRDALFVDVIYDSYTYEQDNAELSDSALGTCVLFLYFGTVLATPLAGKLIG